MKHGLRDPLVKIVKASNFYRRNITIRSVTVSNLMRRNITVKIRGIPTSELNNQTKERSWFWCFENWSSSGWIRFCTQISFDNRNEKSIWMRWNLWLFFRGIVAVEKEIDLKESFWLRSCKNFFFGFCDGVSEDKDYVALDQEIRGSKRNSNWTEETEGKI